MAHISAYSSEAHASDLRRSRECLLGLGRKPQLDRSRNENEAGEEGKVKGEEHKGEDQKGLEHAHWGEQGGGRGAGSGWKRLKGSRRFSSLASLELQLRELQAKGQGQGEMGEGEIRGDKATTVEDETT